MGIVVLNSTLFVIRCSYFELNESSSFVYACCIESSSVELFNEAMQLICKRLMESWKNDFSCALATLEVLSALARVRLVEQSQVECKRAIRLICDFVVSQCSRPAPSHSKVSCLLNAARFCETR